MSQIVSSGGLVEPWPDYDWTGEVFTLTSGIPTWNEAGRQFSVAVQFQCQAGSPYGPILALYVSCALGGQTRGLRTYFRPPREISRGYECILQVDDFTRPLGGSTTDVYIEAGYYAQGGGPIGWARWFRNWKP